MEPFWGFLSQETCCFFSSSVSGRRARTFIHSVLLLSQAPHWENRFQVLAWQWTLPLPTPQSGTGERGSTACWPKWSCLVGNHSDSLLLLSYQQCHLLPGVAFFCECWAVAASGHFSDVLLLSAFCHSKIPKTLWLANSTILWFVVVVMPICFQYCFGF